MEIIVLYQENRGGDTLEISSVLRSYTFVATLYVGSSSS